jgi:cytochrome b subunit of formate dehydrogenase
MERKGNREMADFVQRPLASRAREPTDSARSVAETAARRRRMAPPRSDVGTIILHWTVAVAFLVSLLTGLRMATFGHVAPRFSRWLSAFLPQGEMWTWHFFAGLALFFCSSAYLIYMQRSGLGRRNVLKKLRTLLMPAARRLRWEAINVGLHWVVYGLIVIMTVTGTILYLGYGGWWVWIHSITALLGLAYIFFHVLSHYLQGGWWQLFRLFRPAQLVVTSVTRPYPLLIAAGVGVATIAVAAGIDWGTRDTMIIARVNETPKLDGVLDDAVWTKARPVYVHTQQGANLGGTGESLVEIRAVHDGQNVYFAFQWEDPTRSLRRMPLIKRADGWHVLGTRADVADVSDFYEDKLAIGFSRSPTFGSSESTYLGTKPLTDKPPPLHRLGYHYTASGNLMDVWQWKASRGGHLGFVDDQYFDAPRDVTPAEAAGKARYQAGYWNDPGRAFYVYNYVGEPPGGYRGPVKVQRLPKDWRATMAALGNFDFDPDSSDEEGARWWMMTDTETVPYSAEVDATIPVGTVMPGVLIAGNYEGDRADVRGAAKWRDGRWQLETSRALRTGSKYDHDFVPGRDVYMWVNVFDHTQIRHTRHARPVRIVVKD